MRIADEYWWVLMGLNANQEHVGGKTPLWIPAGDSTISRLKHLDIHADDAESQTALG